ncbi:hypothetical protein ACO34A_28295 (plasmid) [Rhizobium sp. ACO-34A]|nr:hypothetical protein [Rhizobium sp. ACO-34A]ATN37672.1 hypothetical protein ACO34A_28295 [Rhizobium sp. ACO-34A]
MELMRYIMLVIRTFLATAVIAGVMGASAAMATEHHCQSQQVQTSMHTDTGSHSHPGKSPTSSKMLCCSSVCMLCSVVEATDKFETMPAGFVEIRFTVITSFPAGRSTPPVLGPPRNAA